MARGPGLRGRAHRAEAALWRRKLRRLAVELAPGVGMTIDDFVAEADRSVARWRAAGARTLREIAVVEAAETGRDPDVLLAEVRAWLRARGVDPEA